MSGLSRRKLLFAGTALSLAPHRLLARSRRSPLTAMQIESIRSAAAEAVAGGDVPGAISLVFKDGQVRHARAEGLRNIERQLPMERSTIFGIASMSKPVTVALALTLVDEGEMRLDDPITRWAPEFANMRVLRRPYGPLDDTYAAPRAITIEDLMTHRSGLGYGFLAQGPLAGALFGKFGMGLESELSPDAWLQALAALPLAYAPGERFFYGHSIDVLGFVVARALRSTLRDALRERLLEPLKMIDTDFWIPPAKRDRMAQSYSSRAPGEFNRIDIASFVGASARAYTSGGQGLVSTIDDYLTFARMLLRGGAVNGARVLRRETVKWMTANRLTDAQLKQPPSAGVALAPGQGFGLGMSVVTHPDTYRAFGGFGGAGTFGWGGAFGGWWQADPANDLVMLWLQACLPAPPVPGKPLSPHVPGAAGTSDFQKRTYAALRG
jgi:CubicO group peptidase (beta-lactamase class C family)